MSSLQSRLLLPLIYLQRFAQRFVTIEGVRRMSQKSEAPGKLPHGVTVEQFTRGSLKYEWLTPPDDDADKVLYYLHGGGFVFPLWNPLRQCVARIISKARVRALAPHFRLAPEHPFPQAIEDCVAGYRWLITEGGFRPENVTIAGESAGGNLVMGTLLSLRDQGDPLPGKAAAICTPFNLTVDGGYTNTTDPMINPRFISKQFQVYRGDADPRHSLLSPIHADLHGLPPILIQVGSREAFLDESRLFASKAEQAGVRVKLEVWPGMWHGWHLLAPMLPEATQAIGSIADFIRSGA